jgi:hypothetical protein
VSSIWNPLLLYVLSFYVGLLESSSYPSPPPPPIGGWGVIISLEELLPKGDNRNIPNKKLAGYPY